LFIDVLQMRGLHYSVFKGDGKEGVSAAHHVMRHGLAGKQVKLSSSTTDRQLAAVAWSPDGQQLIVARASDGALMLLDIAKLLKAKGVKP